MASVSRLQLSFLGVGLRDKDVFTKSDPYLLLYEIQSNGREKLLGRTETIKNDLNPVWLKRFEVDFLFEARQGFIAKIYDDDGKGVIGDDYLGHVAFPLASVVSGRHGKCEKAIEGVGKKGGRLVLCAQPIVGLGADTLALRFFGTGFKEMAWIGTCDPYLKLYFLQSNGAKVLLHQTAVIKGTVAPHWSPTPALLVSQMATDLNVRTLLVECWHKHLVFDGFIGQFTVSVNELLANSGLPATFELHRPKKPHKIYGRVGVSFAHLHHPPTFLEYLTAGMVMNLTVAIDFTASNGDPRHQSSLHYLNPMRPNQYVQAIQSVGSIVLDYDTDKLVPAFGFGGSVRHVTSHCFHLNAHPDPNVLGLQGILDAYGAALANVPLSGPTNFAPTIRKAAEVARITERGLIYQILVIITDGAITDTDDTIDAIVAAADLPLSIIIIGVGNADFSTMVMLDGDDVRITDRRGKPASRDIVQFVAFRDFANGPVEKLAAEVLREVPRQVETWAASLNVTPQLVSERREHSLSFLSTL